MKLPVELKEPGNVPMRESLNSKSLSIMGIPREFHNKTLKDFNTEDEESMEYVKKFVGEYLDALIHKKRRGYQNGLFLYGSNGVGKTMLSCIILKTAYACRYNCRRVTFTQYINSYTSSWNKGEPDSLWLKCKSSEYLVIEELGKEIDSKIATPVLEDLLRYREEKGYTTIFCTNLTPSSLEEVYGASVVSLIKGSCTPVMIVGTDRRFFE